MSYLRGFAPWLVFAVGSAADWRWAALLALLIVVISLVVGWRAGVRPDAQILEIGAVVYFTGITAFAFAVPDSPLHNYAMAMSATWLALVAVTSLLIGHPFTLGIASGRVPAEVARTPQFRHINTVITGIWAAGFALSATSGYICVALHGGPLPKALCQIVSLGLAALVTHRYTARIKARRAAAVA